MAGKEESHLVMRIVNQKRIRWHLGKIELTALDARLLSPIFQKMAMRESNFHNLEVERQLQTVIFTGSNVRAFQEKGTLRVDSWATE